MLNEKNNQTLEEAGIVFEGDKRNKILVVARDKCVKSTGNIAKIDKIAKNTQLIMQKVDLSATNVDDTLSKSNDHQLINTEDKLHQQEVSKPVKIVDDTLLKSNDKPIIKTDEKLNRRKALNGLIETIPIESIPIETATENNVSLRNDDFMIELYLGGTNVATTTNTPNTPTSSTELYDITNKDNKAVRLYTTTRANSGYVGLVNQAMTCYLNSLLQALYMTPEFRNAMYNWEFDGMDEVKSIPYQLQKLFLNLQVNPFFFFFNYN